MPFSANNYPLPLCSSLELQATYTMKPHSHLWILLLALFSALSSLVGCENSRREYMLALERHDRAVEQAHVARRELVDSLRSGNFKGTESASNLQVSIEEQTALIMYALDRHRPRKPDPVAFEAASKDVSELQSKKDKLLADFEDAATVSSAEKALEISKQIREIDLQLFNATEKMKQSKP